MKKQKLLLEYNKPFTAINKTLFVCFNN